MTTLRNVLAEAPLAPLLFAVPVAAWMHHARPDAPLLVFVLACIAIVPLAGLLDVATDKLAARHGEGTGGLVNATLGNAAGSSTQIALFVLPLLMLLSLVVAPAPLSLAFSGIEVFLVLVATFVGSILLLDGKSTWFSGAQLMAVYLVMALTVFAIPT